MQTGGAADWTIPIHVSVTLGAPALRSPTPGSPAPIAAMPDPGRVDGPRTAPHLVEGVFSRSSELETASHVRRFSRAALRATTFDWNAALSLALASQLAYGDQVRVEHTAQSVWGLTDCRFLSVDDTQCFIAAAPPEGGSSGAILVAFRGTDSVGDWLADLNVVGTTRSYGTVHRGFRSAFAAVDQALRGLLATLPNQPILLTGHSLGGALATVAAAEWQQEFPQIRWVYTYGQPAVGKGRFPPFMAQHYGRAKFVRIVNDDDIVAQVPPTYDHVGRLIHFDADGDVQGAVESLLSDAAAASPTLAAIGAAPGPEVMSESEFDQLRSRLLAQRAAQRTGAAVEAIGSPMPEGLLPSFSDHKLDRYIEKIVRQVDG